MNHTVRGDVELQPLRDFTVQIRALSDQRIVGTGIIVSVDGLIVTCAHVVEMAVGTHPRNATSLEVGVFVPRLSNSERRTMRATIKACFPHHDDDVVVLRLLDPPPPLSKEQIAILGKADNCSGHRFRSYGYRSLDAYNAGYAQGLIMGPVESPAGRKLLLEPVELQSNQINRGMSGAGVLDEENNLVVGIVSETWIPDSSLKNIDTAWAVNTHVLGLEPLNLPVADEPYPKGKAPQPKTNIEEVRAVVAAGLGVAWNNAPSLLPEWVGREDILVAISNNWIAPDSCVTGLIGFGGEGKSSIARHWTENLLVDPLQPKPDGVFWWSFYGSAGVDRFFEEALKYMSAGRIAPERVPSVNIRSQIIGAMLGSGRYLFVLDGLEVMQYQNGDHYGLLRSSDLRDFLRYFITPDHKSHCLVTSRIPLMDLMRYTTYNHLDVMRLNATDARGMLRNLGIKGHDSELNRLISVWDGHALTLSLIGSYLVAFHQGKVTSIDEIPLPLPEEYPETDRRARHVRCVLHYYDQRLTNAERTFLTLFSAFRMPVDDQALTRIFRRRSDKRAFNAPIRLLDDNAFGDLIKRLVDYRLLRFEEDEEDKRTYAMHPLIHAHYHNLFSKWHRAQLKAVHRRIKDFYMDIADENRDTLNLDDFSPLIEAVYHACRAGDYDEADRIHWKYVLREGSFEIIHHLGAYNTEVALLREFFPNGDFSKESLVTEMDSKRSIVALASHCLLGLGRLHEALQLNSSRRALASSIIASQSDSDEDLQNVSRAFQELAHLTVYSGDFDASEKAAQKAEKWAGRIRDERTRSQEERNSLTYLAWVNHLRGNEKEAGLIFDQMERLEQNIRPDARYLYSLQGIWHADYLMRMGKIDHARRITEANLEIGSKWKMNVSQCNRSLGDLSVLEGNFEGARRHYNEAVGNAREVTVKHVLIEALLARGRWNARTMLDVAAATIDLNEALDYAVNDGFRVYEIDLRIALAWAYLASDDALGATLEAVQAKSASVMLGYFWGQIDAAESLTALGQK